MLSRLANIFRVADLRNKVLFTLFVVGAYRLGANLPVPGFDVHAIESQKAQASASGITAFLSLFTGGAAQRMAVFGLGIMPYITSSIIVQMLTTVIPKFMEWRDQGAVGQKKLTQVTRYLTVALALLQSSGLVYEAHHGGLFGNGQDLIPDFTVPRVTYVVLTLTAGTAFVMWLGELITQRGIGQGMSILIFANVLSTFPGVFALVYAQSGMFKLSVLIVLVIAMLVFIVFMEQGQRRIQVTFAKRLQGRRMYGGQSTYIPLKVNQSGVIPVIFASSLLYIPVLLATVVPWRWLTDFTNRNLLSGTSGVYIALYGGLVLVFCFFFVRIVFDPQQQADIIRKQGGYIPGIRPGPPTERHLSRILNRITLPGASYLALFAVLPAIPLSLWHVPYGTMFGVTVLICVGVTLETLRQIDSQLMMRNYEGFLT